MYQTKFKNKVITGSYKYLVNITKGYIGYPIVKIVKNID